MKLYNSATRTRDEFVPNHPDIVKMYTCGPTVYHFAHIGNLRSYIMGRIRWPALPKREANWSMMPHFTPT